MTIVKQRIRGPALPMIVLATVTAGSGQAHQGPELLQSATDSAAYACCEQILASSRPLTDCYGDALPPRALSRLGTVRWRHVGSMLGGRGAELVAFSHDGKAVFTAGTDNPLRLWQVASGKMLCQFDDGSQNLAVSIALSPDGQRLATRSQDKHIFLWDAASGNLLRQWGRDILAIAFSRDGTTLTSVGQDNQLRVWEVATGKELQQHALHANLAAFAFIFSSDSKILVSVSPSVNKRTIVQLWDVATGNRLHQPLIGKGGLESASFVAVSRDGRLLATASTTLDDNEPSDGAVHIWDVAAGRELRRIGMDRAGTWSVAFSPNGELLATGSGFGPIRLWNVASGKLLRCCQGRHDHIVALAFSPDGKWLASGANTASHTARVWDVATGKEVGMHLSGHAGAVLSVAFSSDSKTLVSGGREGTVCLWNPETGEERRPPLVAGDFQAVAALMPNGKSIFSIGNSFAPDNRKRLDSSATAAPTMVRMWDMARGQEKRQFPGSVGFAQSVAVSPNGRFLAAVYIGWPGSQRTCLWDITTGRETHAFGQNNSTCAAFSPDSRDLAVGSADGALSLWNVASGKRFDHWRGHMSSVWCVAFSPDGQILATAGQGSLTGIDKPTIRLWRLRSDKRWALDESLAITTGHKEPIFALAFSRDGKTLASAGQDGVLCLWETITGKERCRFKGQRGEIWCLAFAPDGRRIASGSNDTTILVWDLTGRLEHGQLRPSHPSAEQMEAMWVDLGGTDAVQAGRAIWTLAAAPKQTISYFKKHLSPVTLQRGLRQRIAQNIAKLDDNNFRNRREAEVELIKLGTAAEPALRRALQKPTSLDMKKRLEDILSALKRKRLFPSGEDYRRIRALEVLEQCDTVEARRLLMTLARGEPTALFTQEARSALKRLTPQSVQQY